MVHVMGLFGDSITTDHISPAGNIKKDSPAGRFLQERGVQPADFNSYGSRRGNDDVMVRGTFANIRIKNLMFGGEEGGNTLYYPAGGGQPEKLAIYDAAMKYKAEKVPLVVLAGKEYGTGSSRDWAAKGTLLLGVKAVIAESFERIHRSNLVGMGVLPLQFRNGENAQSLGLDGSEVIDITGLQDGASKRATVTATKADGTKKTFEVSVMLLTPKEVEYFRHGGLLQYVPRQLASSNGKGPDPHGSGPFRLRCTPVEPSLRSAASAPTAAEHGLGSTEALTGAVRPGRCAAPSAGPTCRTPGERERQAAQHHRRLHCAEIAGRSSPTLATVIPTAQNTRSQIGASCPSSTPSSTRRVHRLAIISVPESTGVRNSTKPITTAAPATYGAPGRYSSSLNSVIAASCWATSPRIARHG